MAAVTNVQTGVPGFKNKAEVFTVIYDGTVDAKGTGALDLLIAAKPMIVHRTIVHAQVAVTATGSATVAVGKTGSATAVIDATAGAKANLGLNAVIASSSPVRLAAGDAMIMTIGTDALLTGKLAFTFECYPG